MEEKTRETPTWAKWITYGGIVLAGVALVVTVASVGVGPLLARLKLLGPWLFLVVGLEVLITMCDAGAMHAFLGKARAQSGGFLRTVFCQVSARAINVITPLGSLGEAVRTALLVERVSEARAVTTVLLYNVLGISLSFFLVGAGGLVCALVLDLPDALAWTLGAVGSGLAVASVVLPILLLRGHLGAILGLLRLHKLQKRVASVDTTLRDESGAERRDRRIGFACLLASRMLTWTATAVLVHASGGPTSLAILAAVFTAGQLVTWAATSVPLGLGVAEGGNYALFRALGVDPVIGVTLALGRRVTHILYAGIGVALVAANQTVHDLRHRGRGRARAVTPERAELTR